MNLNYNPCKIKFSSSSSLSGTDCSLFVMTLLCAMRGKSLNKVERDMQLCISRLAFRRYSVLRFKDGVYPLLPAIWNLPVVFGSARRSDPIHHQGLRIALGAFRTSLAQSLQRHMNRP